MIGYPESIVMVGGIFAVAKTAVTFWGPGSSKPDMQPIPPDILAALTKLNESNQALMIQVAEICRDIDHFKGDFKAICKRMENDHLTIKLLRETLISWGRLDAQKEKSATETDTL